MRSRDRCKGDYMKEPIHSVLHDVAIGIDATGMRREIDSMGEIEVPADRYWGAQTQRSLVHFAIGEDRMPKRVYHAYGYVKKAAVLVNAAAGRLRNGKSRRSFAPPTRRLPASSTRIFRSMSGRQARARRPT